MINHSSKEIIFDVETSIISKKILHFFYWMGNNRRVKKIWKLPWTYYINKNQTGGNSYVLIFDFNQISCIYIHQNLSFHFGISHYKLSRQYIRKWVFNMLAPFKTSDHDVKPIQWIGNCTHSGIKISICRFPFRSGNQYKKKRIE